MALHAYASCAAFLIDQLPGRVVLPAEFAGLRVQGVDMRAVVTGDARGGVHHAIVYQHAASDRPGRTERTIHGNRALGAVALAETATALVRWWPLGNIPSHRTNPHTADFAKPRVDI